MKEDKLLPDFAVNVTNRLPFEVAKLLGGGGGKATYNPCWFNAPSGCGKTHLVSIIANECRKSGRIVEKISGEEYINRFVAMMRICNKNEDCTGKAIVSNWLGIDVLIVEELDDCLHGKTATALLLADATKRLIEEQHIQVIITSKRVDTVFYHELKKTCGRLLLIKFSNPNPELRKMITKMKLKEAGLRGSEKIIEQISFYCLNSSQIQGIVEQLLFYKQLYSFEMISEKALWDALKVKGYIK